MSFLEIFQVIITCISPIVVAWFGYRATRNEKATSKYIKLQEENKAIADKLKQKEKEELQAHFKTLEDSIGSMQTQITSMNDSIKKITEIDRMLSKLVKLSNLNFDFCNSLAGTISAIGSALDTSDSIRSYLLQSEMQRHQEKTQEIVNDVCKILY